MKILELANKLKEIYDQEGDIEVLFTDELGGYDGPWSIGVVDNKTVENDEEFPESFNMPKGFKFVLLQN